MQRFQQFILFLDLCEICQIHFTNLQFRCLIFPLDFGWSDVVRTCLILQHYKNCSESVQVKLSTIIYSNLSQCTIQYQCRLLEPPQFLQIKGQFSDSNNSINFYDRKMIFISFCSLQFSLSFSLFKNLRNGLNSSVYIFKPFLSGKQNNLLCNTY